MSRLTLFLILLIIWLTAFIKIELWLLYKSKEKIKEAIEAYRELKKSKQDLEDLFKKG